MTDNQSTEDEYQYPADEYVESGATAGAGSATADDADYGSSQPLSPVEQYLEKLRSMGTRGRIIAVVVVVLVIAIGFRLFGDSSSSSINTPATSTQIAAAEKTRQVQQPIPNQNLAQLQQNESSLDDLKQQVGSSETQIQQIQSQLSQMGAQLTSLSASKDTLNQAVAALAQDVRSLIKKTTKVKRHKKVAAKPITYTIRALVPGRAWVSGSNGQSATLVVGDTLKQYGRVTSIQPEKGLVTTSSGKKIVFSLADR